MELGFPSGLQPLWHVPGWTLTPVQAQGGLRGGGLCGGGAGDAAPVRHRLFNQLFMFEESPVWTRSIETCSEAGAGAGLPQHRRDPERTGCCVLVLAPASGKLA